MASSEQEKQEFEVLYCRYAPVVERFAMALVKDASVAEDICQNVFLNLWNRRRNLPGKDNISAYLFAATRNAVADWFRRYAKIRTLELGDVDAVVEFAGGLDTERLLAEVNACLAGMPTKRREVFLMSRLYGLSNAEIASVMGLGEKAVEYHMTRALKDLRKKLSGI